MLKLLIAVFLVVFAVTLAVLAARVLAPQALAIVVGVVCGIAAGVPTCFLLYVILTRRMVAHWEQAPVEPPEYVHRGSVARLTASARYVQMRRELTDGQ